MKERGYEGSKEGMKEGKKGSCLTTWTLLLTEKGPIKLEILFKKKNKVPWYDENEKVKSIENYYRKPGNKFVQK